jgi:hypothetical protein
MSLIRNIIIGILIVLFSLFLLIVFTSRYEYYINSGTLEYKKKIYYAGILVLEKVEQTKLSEFIQKNEFYRESSFVQIKNFHLSRSSIPFSIVDEKLKMLEKFLIPLYEQKLIDKNETKILIYSLMDIIKKNETLRLESFVGDFLTKNEDSIVKCR